MKDYNERIAILLKKAGVAPGKRGWKYITEAVKIAVEDADIPMMNLYYDIARKFNTTVSGVERAIRVSIDGAFNNMPPNVQSVIFGYAVSYNGKATNREFITTLAELLITEPNNPIWTM